MHVDERMDRLISLIASDEANDEHWTQFQAGADPRRWRQLAEAQRDQRAMARAMDAASAIADRVELPLEEPIVAVPPGRVALHRWSTVLSWSRWAAAAALLLALLLPDQRSVPLPDQDDSLLPIVQRTASDAFDDYLEAGRREGIVVGEVPNRVLLETRPAPSGSGYELLYLRQVLERQHVPALFRLNGQNEQGAPALVRWEQPAEGAM